jgi:hypothetical protein
MIVNALGSSPRSSETAANASRQCVCCREEIRPGAAACRHCGGTLTPLQGVADRQAALEERLAALEHAVAALRSGSSEQAGVDGDAGSAWA